MSTFVICTVVNVVCAFFKLLAPTTLLFLAHEEKSWYNLVTQCPDIQVDAVLIDEQTVTNEVFILCFLDNPCFSLI
jgi:hypothetical protein